MPRWAGNRQSPIDDQIAEADIADRLRMANALRDKSMVGAQLENVGGHLIGNPYARALTGVVQGFEGGREREKAYGMAEDLAASKRDRLAKALAGADQQKTPEDMRRYGAQLLQNPETAEIGQYYITAADKADERAYKENQAKYAETNKDLRNMKTLLGNQDLAAQKAKNDRELAEWKFNHPPPSTAQPPMPAASLQEIEYLRSLDNLPPDQREAKRNEFFQVKRAQQIVDRGGSQDVLQPGAAPGAVATSLPKTLAPNQTPEHEFSVKAAGKQGEAAAALASQQAKAPALFSEAESLLDPQGPNVQLPTQSGVGSVIDRVGNFFGISPDGAPEAARLKVVGGNLTSLVPRFEGPQSDRDTQAYREMAGQIGDETIPVAQRLAALKQVETLINGYGGPAKVFGSGGAPMAPPTEAPPPAGIDPEDWKYLSPEERASFGQ